METVSPSSGRRRPILANGRRATIADVAREAGASKASVSRFLSGDQAILSFEMREKVRQAVDRLGYQPSLIARSLKGGRTRLIGMVVADVENPYSVAVLHGAEAACREVGYTLVLCNTAGDLEQERKTLAALRSYNVEGLVLNAAGWPDGLAGAPALPNVPVVLVDRRLPGGGCDFVGLDNVAATSLAVEHLAGHGFDCLGLFSHPLRGVSTRLERASGFWAAVARRSGRIGDVYELEGDGPAAADEALRRFRSFAAGRRAAVVAANGLVTLRVVQALARQRLRMPDDIGLVGFDELEWSGLVPPGITTMRQPTHDIGATAVRRLLARIGGDTSPAQDSIFMASLIERGSSGAPGGAAVGAAGPPG